MMRVRILPARSAVFFSVDHVNFTVHIGDVLGLYGLVGAGRSSYLNLCGNAIRRFWKIFIQNKEIKSRHIDERILTESSLSRKIIRLTDGTDMQSAGCCSFQLENLMKGFWFSAKKEKAIN
jgi:ABC-type sugar transport system ATPase subunit